MDVNFNSAQKAERFMLSGISVAVCGELPMACDYLLSLGVVNIDKYSDAINMKPESYDIVLVYAPQGEGLMNTWVSVKTENEGKERRVPIRLLNEPTCHSALVELKSKLRRVAKETFGEDVDDAPEENP